MIKIEESDINFRKPFFYGGVREVYNYTVAEVEGNIWDKVWVHREKSFVQVWEQCLTSVYGSFNL